MRITGKSIPGTTVEYVPQFLSDTSAAPWPPREEDWSDMRTPCDYDTFADAQKWATQMGPESRPTRVVKRTVTVEVVTAQDET